MLNFEWKRRWTPAFAGVTYGGGRTVEIASLPPSPPPSLPPSPRLRRTGKLRSDEKATEDRSLAMTWGAEKIVWVGI
jgi:hypothetical protein